MAGESPGKPEQKQSSGETAGSERDPRLAVFREPKADPADPEPKNGTADDAGSKAADEGTGEAAKAGKAGEADKAEKTAAEPAAEPGGEGRDERLREAVAAWVANSDGEDASDGDASGADASGGVASDDVASGGDASDGDAGAGAETRAKAEADEAPVTKVTKSSKASKGNDEEKAGGAPEKAPEATSKTAPESAPEPAPKGASKAAEGAAKGKTEAEPKDKSKSGSRDVSKGASKAGEAAAKSSSGAAADGRPKADEGKPKAAEEQSKAVDQPTAIFKMPSAEEPADDATRAFSIANRKGSDAEVPATSAKDAGKAGKPGSEDAGTDAKTDSKAGTEAEKPGGKPGGKTSGKPEDEPAADQPTTATKVVRPAGAAESDGERTSQFVALKSTDPQPIKPPRPVTGDKPGKGGKPAAEDAAKTEGKPGTGAKSDAKAGKKAGAKPAAEPDVAPGTKWGAKAAGTEAKPAAPEAPAAAASTGATALPDSERTKQQPLPPLDLLAQLTNTPPPPETPLRTVARRFKIWTPLVILLAIIFVVVQQVRPLPDPTLALGGKSAYTFAGDAFQMPWPGEGQAAARVVGVGDVGTYGPQKPVPTASVAKVMTAHLILKNHPLKPGEQGPKIKVDATAVKESGAEDESRVKVKEGQSFTEFQMLQMLLIPSGNNIARLLARWDSPQDEQAFIGKMNAEAKALGMTNTTYTDSSGFKDSTKSTAVDQLKLAEAVMNNEVFRKIVAMPNAQVPGLDQRLENNNSELLIKGTGVLGIKTGSSTPAGGALMWAARRTIDGKPHTIVGVTMDQHFKGLDPNAENSLRLVRDRSYKMIRALQDAMTSADVVKKGDVVGYVDDGLGGRTPVVATKDSKAVGWPGLKAKFSIDSGRTPVPHEAKAGTVVGQLNIGSGPGRATVPVALQKDLAEPSFGAKLKRIA